MKDFFRLFIPLIHFVFALVSAHSQQAFHYGNQAVYTNAESIIKQDSFLIAAGYTSIEKRVKQ